MLRAKKLDCWVIQVDSHSKSSTLHSGCSLEVPPRGSGRPDMQEGGAEGAAFEVCERLVSARGSAVATQVVKTSGASEMYGVHQCQGP